MIERERASARPELTMPSEERIATNGCVSRPTSHARCRKRARQTLRSDEPPSQRPRVTGVVMPNNRKTSLDVDAFLAAVEGRFDHRTYGDGEVLFSQGDPSDKVFYVLEGNVKVGVISKRGKEAVVGIFGPGDFLGELCLSGQQLRISTAIAMNACSVARIAKETMLNLLESDRSFSTLFVEHLLTRNARVRSGHRRSSVQFQ